MTENETSKIDQVLEKMGGIEKDISALKDGQQRLVTDVGQIKKTQLEDGIKLEKLESDIKGVAEGHGILLNKIAEVKVSVAEVGSELKETRCVVGETNRMLKEHVRLPAHVG